MLRKLKRESEHYKSNGKTVAIIGWVSFGIGIFYLFSALTGGLEASEGESIVSGVILALLLFCGGGYALVRHGKKYQKLGDAYDKLWSTVVNSASDSIEELASACNISYENVADKLQEWIDSGKLTDVRIDLIHKKLVSTIKMQTRTLECPNCGGMTTIAIGKSGTCEYCGLTLE